MLFSGEGLGSLAAETAPQQDREIHYHADHHGERHSHPPFLEPAYVLRTICTCLACRFRNMRSSKFYAISALLLSLLVFSAYSLYPLLIKILNTTAFFNVFSQKIMFKPWFLNDFTNVDGMNVSWNGLCKGE